MDEATPTIAPQHSAVIAVLARQSAIKAVKEQLRRQGLKPAHLAKREIVALHLQAAEETRQRIGRQGLHRDSLGAWLCNARARGGRGPDFGLTITQPSSARRVQRFVTQ
jgi:hypothetical protein